jgi:hypothetical protein
MGDGITVFTPDNKTKLTIDHSRPITLIRCREILKAACILSERDIKKITICYSQYSKTPGGDHAEQCFFDKKWEYDSTNNSLLIWENGTPVYSNDNGAITQDQAAIYDSLCM